MRRFIGPSIALVLVILYPLVFTTPFQQRLGALILLYAIAASAWNIIGGYAGQVSVGHVVFFGCGAYASMAAYSHFGLPPLVGIPIGIVAAVLIAAVIGVPTLRLSGHYFSMATIAVAEDATAAQLMGIRPDSMQAIAWAIAAGATGLAGALIATFFYVAPTVGETLGIVAFVTVSLGGFGSVPGALVAGLLIGVIESMSAYLIGAVYKDIVVYTLFLGFLWFRPQGLMGKL